mmetsp:Transcript_7781/g.6953  ORF Transcript_7781/g.6953 Transcript_7781/m.6953 type:complete len:136 (+) Transcript_7781:66-473(+)|eukprot:CAMPEP_0196761166 /NCGR_PEP_ID=MMETSP1095-20130614/324_1 /TAXON_ID=96789 ORGANISM="Chromulina nebulosa, Strain UTEXLB2642" /NCGR_SAMPLE_ID=MMETSP1095 /ASSEMBLY_ACC=CAM_ASM_000446 /LENGTH=135 /DNA_ID=CAMNT_0042110357 /DNA_START=64 /DNA_END=471 /DNA_ORIENTATION=+
MTTDDKIYDEEEVSKHSTNDDCWIILGNDSNGGPKVYDVTKYLNDHPGGPEIITEFAGKNADEMYEDIGHSREARQKAEKYLIGKLKYDPNSETSKAARKKASDVVKSKGGLNPFAVIILLIAIAIGIYYSQLKK